MKVLVLRLFGALAIVAGGIVLLFLSSPLSADSRQPFKRHYDNSFLVSKIAMDVKYNSYYISGWSSRQLYLGNYTAPLLMLEIPWRLDSHGHTYRLEVPHESRLDKAETRVKVLYPYFFITDGRRPQVYSGIIKSKEEKWSANRFAYDRAHFFDIHPISKSSMLLQSVSGKPYHNVLSKLMSYRKSPIVNDSVLKKQVDGLFCTSGTLIYNSSMNLAAYVYSYRNEYVLMDSNLVIAGSGRTLDTISIAKTGSIYVASLKSHKINAPVNPLNIEAHLYKNHLFIHSGSIAKNEEIEEFREASTIDVYDIISKKYSFSFRIPDEFKKKPTSMLIGEGRIALIFGRHLIVYCLKESLLNIE